MAPRLFSERIQYQAVLNNLSKHDGQLRCESCGKKLVSKSECHFDHIFPFAKGGKSTLSNCQILCEQCNLRKNDKELESFILEEKARKFVFGDGIIEEDDPKLSEMSNSPKPEKLSIEQKKKRAIIQIKEFVAKYGDIKKVDLSRARNNLPTISEIRLFFGGLKNMKSELGINTGIQDWDRALIKKRLSEWINENGNLFQSELTKKNGLPSLPCILRHYPELHSFSEIKEMLGLKRTREIWTKDQAIEAGNDFVNKYGPKLRQHHLRKAYGLPTSRTIDRLFGNFHAYKVAIGADSFVKNRTIKESDVEKAIEDYFGSNPRVIKNRSSFFKKFCFSSSAMSRKYGSISNFLQRYSITESSPKKASYTKDEIDKMIIAHIQNGGSTPASLKQLKQLGLPSASSICRYYENWRAPFIYYSRIMEKIGDK